jgi:hypothetical protein
VHLCFIDESGGFEAPASNPSATPLMAIVGLIIDTSEIADATDQLLKAKRLYFPQKCQAPKPLDHILAEVKGGDVRASLRSPRRNTRRHAKGYLYRIVEILEQRQISIVGRVWIKDVGQALDPRGSYTYAIQDIALHFQHFLDVHGSTGLIICDGRMHNQNAEVSHSIFTQKYRAAGDKYPRILEAPAFGSSTNHAGLQIADTVASAMTFPMAARVYCAQQWTGIHTDPHFDDVRSRFAARLGGRQYRYQDRSGRTHGGVVVSDRLRHLSSAKLFQYP